jgi:hypothetical protein
MEVSDQLHTPVTLPLGIEDGWVLKPVRKQWHRLPLPGIKPQSSSIKINLKEIFIDSNINKHMFLR